MSTTQDAPPSPAHALPGLLRQRRGAIVAAWEARVRELPPAGGPWGLRDRLALLIEQIAAQMESGTGRAEIEVEGNLEQVVLGFAVLREVAVEEALSLGAGARDAIRILNRALDEAIAASARRQREEQPEGLDGLRSQIERERERFRYLVHNLDHSVVWEVDARTLQFTFVSARAFDVSGYRAEEWMAQDDWWARHLPRDDYDQLLAMFARCGTDGVDGRFEHALRHRDGHMVYLHTGIHPTITESGPHLQGVSVDITRLRKAIEAREHVLAVVSHDLRNPLNTVSMTAHMLAKSEGAPNLPERLRKSAATLVRATDRMTRLINDLVDLASFEAGHLAVRPVPESAERLVRDAVAANEDVAREHGLRLEVELAPDLPYVLADHDRVLQVFSNLIGNAIKVTPRGGTITLTAEPSMSFVRFGVCDTGPGIALDDLAQIFDRYWRSRSAGYHGSGIGLAIAKALITAQAGTIWAHSEIGQGARFFFTLPLS